MQRNSGIYPINSQSNNYLNKDNLINQFESKRKTVAELVKENELRIQKNKKYQEDYEKRKAIIQKNIEYWREKFRNFRNISGHQDNIQITLNSFIAKNKSELKKLGIINAHELSFLLESKEKENISYTNNIIDSINSLKIDKYNISSSFLKDPSFLDVICINCYEIVKMDQMDDHSSKCSISTSNSSNNIYDNEISFDDCNSRMYKMYTSLKEKSKEIEKTKNSKLIKDYNNLVKITYEILLNNNSKEEIQNNHQNLKILINNAFCRHFDKFYILLDIFCRRLIQLVEIKAEKMEKILNKLPKINNSNSEHEVKTFFFLDNTNGANNPNNMDIHYRLSNILSEVDRQSIKKVRLK